MKSANNLPALFKMKLQMTSKNRKWLHLGFAIEFLILGLFLSSTAAKAESYEERVNKFCSAVVGIPYASDNFTDEEWNRFEYCRNTLNRKK